MCEPGCSVPMQGHRLRFWVSIPVSRLEDIGGHSLPSAPPASPWGTPAAGGAAVGARGMQSEAAGWL